MSEATTIAELRARVDELEEELRQLREPVPVEMCFPIAWRLSTMESKLLAALYRSRAQFISGVDLHAAVYGDADRHESNIPVLISKTRRKLKPYGIAIVAHWGQGFYLPPVSREIIAEGIASIREAQA